MRTIHATCVAIRGAGVLLRGAPGAGKSDLALRLLDRGAELVADDRVALSRRDNVLYALTPDRIAGKLEVRGIGIATFPHIPEAPVRLLVDLVESQEVPRLPPRNTALIQGVYLPKVVLWSFEASATLKVELAVRQIEADIDPSFQPHVTGR